MFLGALFYLIPILFLGLLILAVATVAARRDGDATGRRTYSIYLLIVIYVSIFAGLIALAGVTSNVTDLITADDPADVGEECVSDPLGGTTCPPEDFDGSFDVPTPRTAHASQILLNGLVLAFSILLCLTHRSRFRALRSEAGFGTSDIRRGYNTYLYATSFTVLAFATVATIVALAAVARMIAPSAFSTDAVEQVRDEALTQITTGLVTALAAGALVWSHLREGKQLRREADPIE